MRDYAVFDLTTRMEKLMRFIDGSAAVPLALEARETAGGLADRAWSGTHRLQASVAGWGEVFFIEDLCPSEAPTSAA
jgi:urea transporter